MANNGENPGQSDTLLVRKKKRVCVAAIRIQVARNGLDPTWANGDSFEAEARLQR